MVLVDTSIWVDHGKNCSKLSKVHHSLFVMKFPQISFIWQNKLSVFCEFEANKKWRMSWAALIKCVYEAMHWACRSVDPLKCPRCGSQMKIVSFIEKHQSEVIEKILRHCNLWKDPLVWPPPLQPSQTARFEELSVDYGFFDNGICWSSSHSHPPLIRLAFLIFCRLDFV